jgi:hypothetical protein
VKDPYMIDNAMMESNSVPLDDIYIEVDIKFRRTFFCLKLIFIIFYKEIYSDLGWREFVWGDRSVKVKRNEISKGFAKSV